MAITLNETAEQRKERLAKVTVEGRTKEESKAAVDKGQDFLRMREKAKARMMEQGASLKQATESGLATEEAKAPFIEKAKAVDIKAKEPALEEQFKEAGVFKDATLQEPIIPQEQENLGVMVDIMRGVVKGLGGEKELERKPFFSNILENLMSVSKTEPMTQFEAELKAQEVHSQIKEVNVQILDDQIFKGEEMLKEAGIQVGELPPKTKTGVSKKAISLAGVATTVAGIGIAESVSKPISQFVGTDGQITNLEMALSQYNEMITLPASGFDSGMTAEQSFEQLNRMEEGIIALENQLRLSAIESASVRISLRGRSVDARILKLKQKLQNQRMAVAKKEAARAFNEVPLTNSLNFMLELNKKYYKGKDI